MGGGKNQQRDSTVTSKTELPSWLEGSLKTASTGARGLYDQGNPAYFPDQTYAGFAPQTEQSLEQIEGLAGQPDQAGVLSNYEGLMGGDYLYGGEGFNAALDAASSQIQPRIASMFGSAGRHRSGLAEAAAGRELGNVFAGMYGQERGRQMHGLGMAGQMEQLRGLPAQRLAQVGAAREMDEQRGIDEARARYEHDTYGPQVNLDRYISRIGGIGPMAGGTASETTPQYRNQFAGIAGGALSGLGAGSALGLGLPGIIGGGILGAVGGS